MTCLKNISRNTIPNDIVMSYLKLYKAIGNNPYNHRTLETDNEVMVRQTIANDVFGFTKILGIKISEGRIRSLIYKGVLPKNKDEKLIINLNNAFTRIHNATHTFELLPNEIMDMMKFIYKDVVNEKRLQFQKFDRVVNKVSLLSGNKQSKRDTLDELITRFIELKDDDRYEVSFLIVNFYIDFIKSDIFIEKNREAGLLILFILLLTNEFEVFDYVSFFEVLAEHYDEFQQVVLASSYNWEEGFASALMLHRFILKITLICYDKMTNIIRDYEYDSNLNKSNNIENTINKLDEIFTKDDIRNIHPYISDSTINRTLKRLRDENKIRPLGKGRSAKWMKLYELPSSKTLFEQLDMKI